jgi:hypothetical protein
MVCLRNICINTLHKGDSIYNNNNNNNTKFALEQARKAIFGLHAGNVNFSTQNEE